MKRYIQPSMVMVNLQHQHLICTSMDANGMNTTLQSEEVISGWVKESKKTSGTRSGKKPSGYKQPHPPESGDIQFIKKEASHVVRFLLCCLCTQRNNTQRFACCGLFRVVSQSPVRRRHSGCQMGASVLRRHADLPDGSCG